MRHRRLQVIVLVIIVIVVIVILVIIIIIANPLAFVRAAVAPTTNTHGTLAVLPEQDVERRVRVRVCVRRVRVGACARTDEAFFQRLYRAAQRLGLGGRGSGGSSCANTGATAAGGGASAGCARIRGGQRRVGACCRAPAAEHQWHLHPYRRERHGRVREKGTKVLIFCWRNTRMHACTSGRKTQGHTLAQSSKNAHTHAHETQKQDLEEVCVCGEEALDDCVDVPVRDLGELRKKQLRVEAPGWRRRVKKNVGMLINTLFGKKKGAGGTSILFACVIGGACELFRAFT